MSMKTILREDESGVSEVIGTILILAMTVVLFSVIIIWVSNIPTPTAQTRLDVRPEMLPIYIGPTEVGVNITLLHLGGEALQPVPTIIYVVSQRGLGAPVTDVVILHPYNGLLGTPSGLLDGKDSVWDIGERWEYKNYALRSSDTISITIVDIQKSFIVWTGQLNAPAGTRPPVFVDKWTDDMKGTDAIDPIQANLGFFLYVKVVDPDGDINRNSVFATLTMWYGIDPTCSSPQKMHDDGVAPDRVPGDDIYALGNIICMSPPYPPLTWDGSIILLNATDLKGHQTTTRLVLHVVEQTSGGGGGGGGRIPSELWQYIGYVQIRTGEVWVTNLGQPYSTTTTFQPYRVTKSQLNSNGGALFHFKMANHGNTTIFIDGWTVAFFTSSQSAGGFAQYIVKPVDPTIPANAGGILAYPGIASNVNDFQYAQVFDINVANQEIGGTPTVVLVAVNTPFKADWGRNWGTDSMFINILISGMAGPSNYTYSQLIGSGPNPRNCLGLGAGYNPINHLNDAIVACRSSWYAQVIPFIGMVIY